MARDLDGAAAQMGGEETWVHLEPRPLVEPLYEPRMMNTEQSVEWELTGESEELGENLPQYHFVHHKSHVLSPVTKPGPPELWHGLPRNLSRRFIRMALVIKALVYHSPS
jgi:hypothetical protein